MALVCENLQTQQEKYQFSPGQGRSSQRRISASGPGQCAPPYAGGGLVHVRDRFRMPSPQVTEQGLQARHSVQFPSTIVSPKRRLLKEINVKLLRITVLYFTN